MKINVKGNAVTPDTIADALRACEKEYNLKIKSATLYVRFENDLGQTVEPLYDGSEIVRDFVYRRSKEAAPPQSAPEPQQPPEPISAKDMIELCQQKARRMLANYEMKILISLANITHVDRAVFENCLNSTLQSVGRFEVRYLEKLVMKKYGY